VPSRPSAEPTPKPRFRPAVPRPCQEFAENPPGTVGPRAKPCQSVPAVSPLVSLQNRDPMQATMEAMSWVLDVRASRYPALAGRIPQSAPILGDTA